MLKCGLPQKPTRHAKTELGTFTRCSSSLDTSALSTRRSLTQSFTATRTSLTGESVRTIDHTYESWADLHITVDKYGGSRYGGDSNFHLPKISVPHTGCGKTRQAGDRGGDSCLWTEFVRWLHPCTRGFSTANADIQVET